MLEKRNKKGKIFHHRPPVSQRVASTHRLDPKQVAGRFLKKHGVKKGTKKLSAIEQRRRNIGEVVGQHARKMRNFRLAAEKSSLPTGVSRDMVDYLFTRYKRSADRVRHIDRVRTYADRLARKKGRR